MKSKRLNHCQLQSTKASMVHWHHCQPLSIKASMVHWHHCQPLSIKASMVHWHHCQPLSITANMVQGHPLRKPLFCTICIIRSWCCAEGREFSRYDQGCHDDSNLLRTSVGLGQLNHLLICRVCVSSADESFSNNVKKAKHRQQQKQTHTHKKKEKRLVFHFEASVSGCH